MPGAKLITLHVFLVIRKRPRYEKALPQESSSVSFVAPGAEFVTLNVFIIGKKQGTLAYLPVNAP
jgi:hypothetical protein